MWDVPPPPAGAARQQSQAAAAAAAGHIVPFGGAAPPVLAPNRDGTTYCPAFQRGQCREPCPQKKTHVCAALLTTGRPCGMKNHAAERCFNKKKALALSC